MAARDTRWIEKSPEAMKRICRGAFLTVRNAERLNTMTIGWAKVQAESGGKEGRQPRSGFFGVGESVNWPELGAESRRNNIGGI